LQEFERLKVRTSTFGRTGTVTVVRVPGFPDPRDCLLELGSAICASTGFMHPRAQVLNSRSGRDRMDAAKAEIPADSPPGLVDGVMRIPLNQGRHPTALCITLEYFGSSILKVMPHIPHHDSMCAGGAKVWCVE
jgi:hypothetical protein